MAMADEGLGWRDITRGGRGDLEESSRREREAWTEWMENSYRGPPPQSLVPQFRWVVEKLLRRLEPSVVDEDLCIARKIQTECTARARAILEASGPQRDTAARMEARRRLREKAKRLAETVQKLRREVADTEKSGLIPETVVQQLKVEVEAEKRVLEDRLRDWTRQLEAGRLRIEQVDEAVDRVKQEMQLEQQRHAQTMPSLRTELDKQQALVQRDLAELHDFEEQAEPVVTAYQKMQSDMSTAAQKSQEWREELFRVAGNYSEEISRLGSTALEIQGGSGGLAAPFQPERSPAPAPAWSPEKLAAASLPYDLSPVRERGERTSVTENSRGLVVSGGSPGRIADTLVTGSPGAPAFAESPVRQSPSRPGLVRADQHVAELSLIHSEALRTTDLLEREIDALRDAVRTNQ